MTAAAAPTALACAAWAGRHPAPAPTSGRANHKLSTADAFSMPRAWHPPPATSRPRRALAAEGAPRRHSVCDSPPRPNPGEDIRVGPDYGDGSSFTGAVTARRCCPPATIACIEAIDEPFEATEPVFDAVEPVADCGQPFLWRPRRAYGRASMCACHAASMAFACTPFGRRGRSRPGSALDPGLRARRCRPSGKAGGRGGVSAARRHPAPGGGAGRDRTPGPAACSCAAAPPRRAPR